MLEEITCNADSNCAESCDIRYCSEKGLRLKRPFWPLILIKRPLFPLYYTSIFLSYPYLSVRGVKMLNFLIENRVKISDYNRALFLPTCIVPF